MSKKAIFISFWALAVASIHIAAMYKFSNSHNYVLLNSVKLESKRIRILFYSDNKDISAFNLPRKEIEPSEPRTIHVSKTQDVTKLLIQPPFKSSLSIKTNFVPVSLTRISLAFTSEY